MRAIWTTNAIVDGIAILVKFCCADYLTKIFLTCLIGDAFKLEWKYARHSRGWSTHSFTWFS